MNARSAVILRLMNRLMAALFVVAALLQFNDPDPVRWVAIYLAAALACLWPNYFGRGWPVVPGFVGTIALVWATLSYTQIGGQLNPMEMFRPMEEGHPEIEVARESVGLLMVGGWMGVQCLRVFSMRKAPDGSEGETPGAH